MKILAVEKYEKSCKVVNISCNHTDTIGVELAIESFCGFEVSRTNYTDDCETPCFSDVAGEHNTIFFAHFNSETNKYDDVTFDNCSRIIAKMFVD